MALSETIHHKFLKLLLPILCLIPWPLSAASFRFIRANRLESFSNSSVVSIYQDGLGAIWLNSTYGLYRYNGTSLDFLQRPMPKRPLCGNGNELVYICSYDAILCYDIRTNRPRRLCSPEIDYPNCALYAEEEQLWVGSGNRIYKRSGDSLRMRHELPHPHTYITALCRSQAGTLLAATSEGGLYEIDGDGKIHSRMAVAGNICTLYPDSRGDLWIGTMDRGCWRLGCDYKVAGHYHREASGGMQLKNNLVRTFCEDQKGNLWIGTMSGVDRLGTDRLCRTDELGALGESSVWSLRADNQGGIWVGTFYDGIYYCNSDNYPFNPILLPAERKVKLINAMVEDKRGDLWILTDKFGMFRQSAHDGQIRYVAGSGSHKFKSAWYDADEDAIWTGSYMGTLRKYDIAAQSWSDYTFCSEDGTNGPETVNDIKCHDGRLYLGTTHGVLVFDKRSAQIVCSPIKGYNGIVFSLAFDALDRLWIGGIGVRILDLKTGHMTRYVGLDNNDLNFIKLFCDHDGCMWGASLGQGFIRLDMQQGVRYKQENIGLADNFTSFIGEVNPDVLLIGTNSGLSLFNTRTNRCYNYNHNNGLSISSARSGCILRRANGDIVIGGIDGVETLTPSQVEFSDDSIDIAFDRLIVNNRRIYPGIPDDRQPILQQELPFTQKLVLQHRQRNLSVELASFDFEKVYPIFYEYILEGYDNEWTLFSPEHPIVYMNLPPGDYRLCVRAAYSKFSNDHTQITLPIEIHAAWYATLLARIFYCIAGLTLLGWLLYAFYSRMLLAERLKQKEAENLERMRFFINISHELRTPLTLIIGQLELFFRNHGHSSSGIENIENTYRNALNMQRLVSDLLDFEKQNQGYTNITVSKTNLGAFIADIRDSFAQYANYRNIRLELHLPAETVTASIDNKQMQRVFSNLLINAFKYTPDGGRIDISMHIKHHLKEDNTVTITFADTGCGISEKALPHIFDPFYQDPATTSRDRHNHGTGIGLALSRGILELHHGTLTAQNNRNGGALFTVTLPSGQKWYAGDDKVTSVEQSRSECVSVPLPSRIHTPAPVAAEAPEKGYKMLIVEDDAELRTLLYSIFKRDYRVCKASDGAEGHSMAKKLQPDIVISDVVMPVMDGLSLCGKLRQDLETCHIPIILLTAQPSTGLNFESFSQGADDYITKPFNISQLEARCRNLLENRQRMRRKYSRSIAGSDVVTTNDKDANFLAAATEAVERNLYKEDINVQTLCRELNVSKTILTQKIKGITGHSPGEFIEMIRFKKAATLLCDGGRLISEVSYELGFSSPKYFTIRFKKQFGLTPTQFQVEHARTKLSEPTIY